MNHSSRFWRLLGRLNASVDRAKVWLDVHGADLHRYGEVDNGPMLPLARRGRPSDTAD
jgi:hypothetical protein